MPKVSVIVPNYNHAPFLKQRIATILDQTYRDYELIILDDGSTDESLDIIRDCQARIPHIATLINDRNSGNPFKQWDRGVLQSDGEYIWIAESDDIASPDYLEKMVPVLEENRQVGLVCCDNVNIDNSGQVISSLSEQLYGIDKRRTSDYINNGRDEIKEFLCYRNTIPNVSGVLFRKAAYIKAGLADTGMHYCGDWYLYLRMLLDTDMAYVAASLNQYRIHEDSSRHRYYVDQRYLDEVLQIVSFVTVTLVPDSRAAKKIRNEIARHFCLALKSGHLPPKSTRQRMKKIAPFLELNIMGFLANHFVQKFSNGLSRKSTHVVSVERTW